MLFLFKPDERPILGSSRLHLKGETELVKYLKDETGKTEKALAKSLKSEIEPADASRFRTACQSDDELWSRVQPLAGLVRLDNFGYPVVIPTGSVLSQQGPTDVQVVRITPHASLPNQSFNTRWSHWFTLVPPRVGPSLNGS